MELFTAAEDLKFFNAYQITNEAVRIPARSSPLKFFLITLILILPLSLIQLAFDYHTSFLFENVVYYFSSNHDSSPSFKQFVRTYSIQEFFYVPFLFLFFLLSTSAVVFTVASLYASKPVSFIPTLFAIPRIFKHLVITFFYASLLMLVNYLILVWLDVDEPLMWGVFAIIHDLAHVYVTALWHLASVISVLEPNVYGLAAMEKSKQLLQGRTKIALVLAILYLGAIWIAEEVCELPMQFDAPFIVSLLLILLGFSILAAVNLTGLLVQSVFFFACKSHHNQVVDKKVLYDHLGGYDLRDKSVALNPSTGSMEMQSFVKDHDRVDYEPVALNATTPDTVADQNVENEEPNQS